MLPPFHIYSMVVNLLFGLHLAAELYLHLRFDVEAVLRDIHEHRLSVIPAVPTMFIALIHHPDVARFDLTSLKMCNSGGAPYRWTFSSVSRH
ncbi:AMP-binding protein [Alcanivorax sp. IO_7]|nr:AMP-binding protein [Alcanivorax sp. IO_7]